MTCEKCNHKQTISFEEWKYLTEVMLTFVELSKEQKDMVLLMIDGAMYRSQRKNELSEKNK